MRRDILGCAKHSRKRCQPRDTFWLAHYNDIRRQRRIGHIYCSVHDLSSSKIDVDMGFGSVSFFDLNIHLIYLTSDAIGINLGEKVSSIASAVGRCVSKGMVSEMFLPLL